MPCRSTTTAMPPASPAAAARMHATATADVAAAAALRLRQDARLERCRPGDPRGVRRARRAARRPGRARSPSTAPERWRRRPARPSRTSSWPRTTARCSIARPTRSARRWPPRSRQGRRVRGVDYVGRARGPQELYRETLEELFQRLRHDPHPGGARRRAQGLRDHRRSRVLRLLDLSRRAGRDRCRCWRSTACRIGVQLVGPPRDDGRLLRTALRLLQAPGSAPAEPLGGLLEPRPALRPRTDRLLIST